MLNNSELHDVCFIVSDERISANRAVLGNSNSYFKNLLFNENFKESKQNEIMFEEEEKLDFLTPAIFRKIIKFCYLRDLNLSDPDVGELKDLLCAANYFEVIELIDKIVEYILDEEFLTEENCFYWYMVGDTLNYKPLTAGIKSRAKKWRIKARACKFPQISK